MHLLPSLCTSGRWLFLSLSLSQGPHSMGDLGHLEAWWGDRAQWLMFPIQPQIDYNVACFLRFLHCSSNHPASHLISIKMGHPGSDYDLIHLYTLAPILEALCSSFAFSLLLLCVFPGGFFMFYVFQPLPPFFFLYHHYLSLEFSLVAPISHVSSDVFSPLCHMPIEYFFPLQSYLISFGGLPEFQYMAKGPEKQYCFENIYTSFWSTTDYHFSCQCLLYQKYSISPLFHFKAPLAYFRRYCYTYLAY